MFDWQPIETAPRDGSRIIVAMSDDFMQHQPWNSPGDEYCIFVRWVSQVGYWVDDYKIFVTDDEITHWAPAPVPPQATAHQRMRDAAAIAKHRADNV
ncbi:hypothetical protein [Azospirillum sp. TSO35-2]|uniref:hypothetical protein n=1 Tax=Azospirillum sp. TSO35-2 TaxID=716796 RepID=UPI000D64D321|nr:hypothetical protein [Azospirillum sp. TSO35-2]